RVTDAVFALIRLERLGEHVGPVDRLKVTAAIERPHIPVRLAVHDPFRHDPAGAAGLCDPESERAAVEEVARTRGRTHERIADPRATSAGMSSVIRYWCDSVTIGRYSPIIAATSPPR